MEKIDKTHDFDQYSNFNTKHNLKSYICVGDKLVDIEDLEEESNIKNVYVKRHRATAFDEEVHLISIGVDLDGEKHLIASYTEDARIPLSVVIAMALNSWEGGFDFDDWIEDGHCECCGGYIDKHWSISGRYGGKIVITEDGHMSGNRGLTDKEIIEDWMVFDIKIVFEEE